MKIWFDLSNSPHVNMFADMIRELQKDHQVILTCRPLANTVDLLDLHGFEYSVVGKHYGGKMSSKLFGFPVRVWQLLRFLKKQKADVAISQSSFYSPITARLLGVPVIYMNDNEHAMGNIPSFVFANRILIPEFLDTKKIQKQWARKSKIVKYPGVKEGIYLWQTGIKIEKLSRPAIYIRPEPWIAQYYKGALNFMDNMIMELKEDYDIFILPRGKDQAKHYEQDKFKGLTVQSKALDLLEIAGRCSLFIGAGGTMTREMAVLGIPTISVYQDELLDVDRYLIREGMLVHEPDICGEKVRDFLLEREQAGPNDELLKKGKDSYNLIIRLLLNKCKGD